MFLLKCIIIYFSIITIQLPFATLGQETKAIKYFLNKTQIEVKPLTPENAYNGRIFVTEAENLRDLYSLVRNVFAQHYFSDYKNNYKFMENLGKLQPQRSANEPFPCPLNNTRSLEPPSSVHRLRPGDIDIIGAIGDSLTAGTAMMSKLYFQLLTEFRAQTVLGGGLKDWRSFLTLPNILKVFNPNLYGYAVANTLAKYRGARFNVAEAFALTEDMPYMAEVLVKRMQRDPKVNMAQHWKMVSIFIGSNDICNQMCHYDNVEDFLTNHTNNLHKTLTILRDNIPRLMVNVVPIPDIDDILHKTQVPAACDTLHKLSCPCLIGNSITSKQLQERHKVLKRFQQIDLDVASLPEFQREDFAAVPRSLSVNKTLRLLKNGSSDLRYFAMDCFHFSQYGNAAFSTMMWNGILQVKGKPTNYILKPFEVFVCPTEERPYISTLSNS